MDSVYLGVIRPGDDRKGPQSEGFPVYWTCPAAWLFYNGLPAGESSTASRHSLSMDPRRSHRNRPIAGRKRARLHLRPAA